MMPSAETGLLTGLHVVVTRPAPQATGFLQALEQAGANTYSFPLLAVRSLDTPPASLLRLQEPGPRAYDLVIFISVNAVSHALSVLGGPSALAQCTLGAIGQKTAHALQQQQLQVTLVPQQGYTTEDFLALPEVQQMQGQRVLIVRGQGGRALLGVSLQARGAQLSYADVYQRFCPAQDTTVLKQLHEQGELDIITLTSSESLAYLLQLPRAGAWLYRIPLLVGSSRMAVEARQAGFTAEILVADDPTDQAMLNCLLQWRQPMRTP